MRIVSLLYFIEVLTADLVAKGIDAATHPATLIFATWFNSGFTRQASRRTFTFGSVSCPISCRFHWCGGQHPVFADANGIAKGVRTTTACVVCRRLQREQQREQEGYFCMVSECMSAFSGLHYAQKRPSPFAA